MQLYMPVKVYHEKNSIRNHAAELTALGTKPMIVTGRTSSRKNGSLDALMEVLTAAGQEPVIFDEIEENPSVWTVERAAKIGRSAGVDYCIGLGGGSPMDSSKAIALLIANPTEDWTLLFTASKVGQVNEALPVAAIPTTAGTGSEVTQYAVFTRPEVVDASETEEEQKAHYRIKQGMMFRVFPKLALTDPSYLAFCPKNGRISTAVDTLAHLVESQLNTNSTAYSRVYSEAGLRMWGELKDDLLAGEITDDLCDRLAKACTMGGISIAHTSTSLCHVLSYAVTVEMGVPHGKACGLFLPGYLKVYEDQTEAARVLELLGFENLEAFTAYLWKLMGCVELSDDIWERDVDAMMANTAKLKNYPYTMTMEAAQMMRP